ncbi:MULTISPECIES: hypothetical protein [Pseudomonas]|nr:MULTISPECIES: hypothetical protein [Pseudomonas]MBD9546111.1 hypothetical protein [Pseudomonas sp. PDM01]MCP1521331.1 hypothetical protein [Pseudomonas migulae]UCP08201.1 hypothetical protein K5R88_20575 [Pseudomonas sp. MM213]
MTQQIRRQRELAVDQKFGEAGLPEMATLSLVGARLAREWVVTFSINVD